MCNFAAVLCVFLMSLLQNALSLLQRKPTVLAESTKKTEEEKMKLKYSLCTQAVICEDS